MFRHFKKEVNAQTRHEVKVFRQHPTSKQWSLRRSLCILAPWSEMLPLRLPLRTECLNLPMVRACRGLKAILESTSLTLSVWLHSRGTKLSYHTWQQEFLGRYGMKALKHCMSTCFQEYCICFPNICWTVSPTSERIWTYWWQYVSLGRGKQTLRLSSCIKSM